MRPPAAARLFALFIFLSLSVTRAAEPFFKKGDVIALVGGEDMVVASEYGYLELLLVRALPDYKLRFRNLAWEGDTVFEQRRDLNFPTWEEQLDKIGATVVIAQFGQMESLAAKGKVPEFIAAYDKLLERFSGGGKRRVAIVVPAIPFVVEPKRRIAIGEFLESFNKLKPPKATRFIDAFLPSMVFAGPHQGPIMADFYRDGLHFGDGGHRVTAMAVANGLIRGNWEPRDSDRLVISDAEKPLAALIVAKNRLWFDYWRPQNWAFLAGDRTAQPSSRDHLDPSKRWFPPEREAFLPLIEAKEREIDALAQKLAQP